MSYGKRIESESGIYHVMCRGVGRQIIFEDDADRSTLLEMLARSKAGADIGILAWCLMDNHFHLLVRASKSDLSVFMKRVLSAYARRFNERHDRVGHLFQDRFKSIPVESDSYLLSVVRYIHQNPIELGILDFRAYPWSSYQEYLGNPAIADPSLVLGMFESPEEFDRFNQMLGDEDMPGFDTKRIESLRTEAAFIALEELGSEIYDLKALPRHERNAGIEKLLRRGLSIRQIERLTGVGRGIVAKISRNMNA